MQTLRPDLSRATANAMLGVGMSPYRLVPSDKMKPTAVSKFFQPMNQQTKGGRMFAGGSGDQSVNAPPERGDGRNALDRQPERDPPPYVGTPSRGDPSRGDPFEGISSYEEFTRTPLYSPVRPPTIGVLPNTPSDDGDLDSTRRKDDIQDQTLPSSSTKIDDDIQDQHEHIQQLERLLLSSHRINFRDRGYKSRLRESLDEATEEMDKLVAVREQRSGSGRSRNTPVLATPSTSFRISTTPSHSNAMRRKSSNTGSQAGVKGLDLMFGETGARFPPAVAHGPNVSGLIETHEEQIDKAGAGGSGRGGGRGRGGRKEEDLSPASEKKTKGKGHKKR
jgi:hypothetical protein